MRVLIACEWSGRVRDAFLALGHDAVSSDLQPSMAPGPHYQGDVRDLLGAGWDLLIAFPPCTYLAASGARWWPMRQQEQAAALAFVQTLLDAPVPRIVLENPVGCLSTRLRPPDQIVQPWMFGHAEIKTTCLWLKHVPLLQPTVLTFAPREQRCWRMGQSRGRAQARSLTYQGVASAMAQQWSHLEGPPRARDVTDRRRR
jgi:hypothetical protein